MDQFIKTILLSILSHNKTSAALHLLLAQFYYYRLDNRVQAILELIAAEQHQPFILDEFPVFRLKEQIQKDL